MNMWQMEEQGGEEAGAGETDFMGQIRKFLLGEEFRGHDHTNLPCLYSSGHISISSGTMPETPSSSCESKDRIVEAVEKDFQSQVKQSLPDLEGEEVGAEVESKSQIPVFHHSMEEEFALYQKLYPFKCRNMPETPPYSPFFPKLLDQGRHDNTALLNQWDYYFSSLLLFDMKGEVHPLYEGVRKSKWRPGKWEAEVMGRTGRRRLYLGAFYTPEDAARAHDRAAFRIWGRRARLNFREFNARGHPIPATHISERMSRDHVAIQIQQLEEQDTMPTPTDVVQAGLWVKIKTTLGKKATNRINRSTQGIPNELLVGLVGATYQYMSMPLPNGNRRYILTVANALGFLFLLIGMVRRARKCSCANFLLFVGTLLSSGGIVFSMSRDIHGLLGWFLPVACLFAIMTSVVF